METMITSLAAQGGGGGGLNPIVWRLSLRQSAYREHTVWVWTYYDGVFLCTLNFYLAAQGGGFKPPKPPPLDPPLD